MGWTGAAMLGVLVRLMLMLSAIAAGLIGVARGGTPGDADLGTIILPASECAHACWNGIEVGVTTRDQATQILETSPWVAQVFQTSLTVTWRWSGSQPPQINAAKDGLLQIGNDIVRQIRIQTLIPFGDIWLLLDRPDNVRVVQLLSRSSSYQIASYDVGIQVISPLGCSLTPERFWSAPITLGMGEIWSTEALSGRGFDIYRAPSWWERLRLC
ncbi:MAG: hypothetical protein U0703_18810 [Anaerolineae bacterium]